MAINANNNETPNEERDSTEVSASEVPINHLMEAIDESDSDFDDNTSDDLNDRNYELLSTQDISADSGQQTTYYPHNYVVEWTDWDQYEANQQQTNDGTGSTGSTASAGQRTSDESKGREENETNIVTNESSNERQMSLTNDRINEIKTLMSGFELPNDNIPVWAQEVPEDQWKTFLLRKLENK